MSGFSYGHSPRSRTDRLPVLVDALCRDDDLVFAEVPDGICVAVDDVGEVPPLDPISAHVQNHENKQSELCACAEGDEYEGSENHLCDVHCRSFPFVSKASVLTVQASGAGGWAWGALAWRRSWASAPK